jgi:hypothetical protein
MTYDTAWPDAPIRYVITHLDKKAGMRTLAEPMQGRFTYETAEQAQAQLDAIMAGNNKEKLESLFGLPLEVRPVPCWPGHFDPMVCWLDIEAPCRHET